MHQVTDDRDGDPTAFGLGTDAGDLVVVAVDQGDPGTTVIGVTALGVIEDRGHDGGGVGVDARTLFAEATRHARHDLDALVAEGIIDEGAPPIGWQLAPPALITELEAADDLPAGAFRLIPMRQPGHFNSQLARAADTAGVFVNPDDAARIGLHDGKPVTVASAHGRLTALACIDARCTPGVVGVPHGFEGANVNTLTTDGAVEPLTGMPTYSGLEVTLSPCRRAAPPVPPVPAG